MRAATLPIGTLLLAAAMAFAAPVQAQDFEDEFDAEGSNPPANGSPDGGTAAATTPGGHTADEDELGDTTHVETPVAPATDTDAAEAWRNELFLTLHNTVEGSTGGIHTPDARGAPSRTFRVQLATDFFFENNFLNKSSDPMMPEQNSHIGALLTASWSPFEFLELYSSLSAAANHNNTEDPALFQVLGDASLGAKLWYTLPSSPFFTVGGDLRVVMLDPVGDIGLKSASAGFRANATIDLRRLTRAVPFIARASFEYYLDNSTALTEPTERARYDRLVMPAAYADETRNLLTRVERFALGINRLDMFNIRLGFEAPIKVGTDFFVSPMAEMRIGVPVNRSGYNCLYRPSSAAPLGVDDSCLNNIGFSAFPTIFTLGARLEPPVRGLSFLLAFDVAATGVNRPVRELAQAAPYDVWLGVSWAYDTRVVPPLPPVVREVEHRVEVPAVLPVKGRIHGLVVEQGANTPVAGAIIRFPGKELTALHAGEDGTFTTYEFDPGEIQIEVEHPEYQRGTCTGTIPADRAAAATPVEVRCELVALPRLGTAHGRVTSDAGLPVSTTITLTGPSNRAASAGADGGFTAEGLTPGSYTARVEADGFLVKIQQFEVRARENTTVDITLVTRPRRATVTLGRREITIRRQINFATDSDVIDASSNPLLAEIADVIQRNPQITKIEIQGHTDNVGQAPHNMELSQRRAESVRTWLVAQGGVDAGRLEAHGYGSTRPQVPNITASNRARNRRTQFLIMEQAAAGGGEAAPAPAPTAP